MTIVMISSKRVNPNSAGIDLSHQSLPSDDYKVDPRTVRINIFLMVVDLSHRYSNESERANEEICDDFKLK